MMPTLMTAPLSTLEAGTGAAHPQHFGGTAADIEHEGRFRLAVHQRLRTHGGEAFDPEAVRPKSVEDLIKERRSGGLGLRIIRSVMDEVEYRIVPGELNVLRMLKWLRKPAA